MKLKCLFLDHDDTVFDSTQFIHYPSFCETLRTLRPDLPLISFEAFTDHCHRLGFQDLCDNHYAFTPEEMAIEYRIWKSYTQNAIPLPYPGWEKIFTHFRGLGGRIVVISHSESSEIRRDYHHHFGFEPDLIYGWELGASQRKPQIFPIQDSLKRLALEAEECLMVDDMSLGYTMALNAQVPFAWASWSQAVNITEKNSSIPVFTKVDELYQYILEKTI